MRFTITNLGGAGQPIARIAGSIVRYLQPRTTSQPPVATDGSPGSPAARVPDPARYYADGGDQPGRWRGEGAAALGLRGQVDENDFARVLAGRDPATGARLISAQGSAGRRPNLGVGAETRLGPDGELLYGARDAAAQLGLPAKQVARMIDAGVELALPHLFSRPTGDGLTDPPGSSYLVPFIDGDGTPLVPASELARCQDALQAGTSADQITTLGHPDDQLPLAEAARLAGVTRQYLHKLVTRYETDKAAIDSLVAAGKDPRRDYLIATRDERRRWLVRRTDLAAYLARRRPPAVRVGYDLTLTTEKSLGVLALLSGDRVRRRVLDAIQAGND